MKKVDMSSDAITKRLRRTDQLRELSLSLMKAKKDSDAKAAREKQAREDVEENSKVQSEWNHKIWQ